jgi:succinate dehydrogenase/fumarate reductase flavoprotein subunit
MMSNERQVDLLVLGGGAAGMTAALTAAVLGLDVLLVEKTERVGGTSARSAGSLWVPNSRHSPPGSDSPDNALRYLRAVLGNRLDETRARAFLDAAPEMVAFLEDNSALALRAYAHHPDYRATLEGATLSGRVLEPVPFDASVLTNDFAKLRPPLPEFMLLGGMMVDRPDITHLLNARRSFSSLRYSLGLLARYGADRLRFDRGARLVMGNALVARLYYSLLRRRVPILVSTQALSLTQSEGRVTGALLQSGAGRIAVRTRAGVVLATGGFSHNLEMRRRLLPAGVSRHSPVAESAQGDGIALGEQAGGWLSIGRDGSNGFWSPVSLRRRRDGSIAVFPHLVLDRGKPGLIAITPRGHRFVSEAVDYHRFAEAMLAALANSPGEPCFLICDDAFLAKYGLGMVRPGRINLRQAVADGYVRQAHTLEALAQAIDVPPQALAQTVARHNGFVRTGVDADFAKGSDAYQQNLGDPRQRPNPCIGPIEKPPFYALAVHPSDIGTSCGLLTDEFAQVLREDASAISGLYACGSDMASIMAGAYPGPGINIGPGMTFAFIAALHAAADLLPGAARSLPCPAPKPARARPPS